VFRVALVESGEKFELAARKYGRRAGCWRRVLVWDCCAAWRGRGPTLAKPWKPVHVATGPRAATSSLVLTAAVIDRQIAEKELVVATSIEDPGCLESWRLRAPNDAPSYHRHSPRDSEGPNRELEKKLIGNARALRGGALSAD